MASKKTLLLIALGVGAYYLYTRSQAQAAQSGLPAGAMNPYGYAPNAWWQAPAAGALALGVNQLMSGGGGSPLPVGAMNPAGFASPAASPSYG
jgi:hypothetical protein